MSHASDHCKWSSSRSRESATGDGDEYDAGMAGLSDEAALERLVLSGGPLRIDEVVAVARGRVPVELSEEGRKRMSAAREVVERAVAEGRRVYGVSTGFGLLANTPIAPTDLRELQRRIVVSHATGSGDPLDGEVVRAMQLLRARTLAQGYSGVRPVVVEALLALLTAGVMPLIPEHGSVGASGDLAHLAHLALPLIGEGEVEGDGERLPGGDRRGRAGQHGGRRLRHVGRGAARHRPAVPAAPPRAAAAPRPARQRAEPPGAAGGLAHPGQSPPLRPRHPGRLLAALRPAGARRLQGRAGLRPPGGR